ncbi:MAG: M23 family metallopeptidase [Desulfobulbaceae bacterium]|nr:M23 family metallopeptidase [Desulfobulbaceae bacterium]
MQDKLMIVFTSELGKTRSLSISKTKLKHTLCVSAILLVIFSILSVAGIKFSYQNVGLRIKTATLQRDLDHTRSVYENFQQQVAEQEAKKENMLQTALSELKKRSKIIESILDTVGVDFQVQVEESSKNTGGPYTNVSDQTYEDLTFKVDHYLETIQSIPLGIPTPGKITSKFGKRVDPINNRPAFHEGVDIKNKRKSPIRVTADGVVAKSGYTSGFGNYVVINHGNGFRTRYFHMIKRAVKRGEAVKRGQLIGYLGSTGRSTGPHLHYEIQYKSKPINPMKFIQIAKYLGDPDKLRSSAKK